MRLRSWPMTKKQYKTPKVKVGTVKKSMAAIASRWFCRKVCQCLADSGFFGALLTHRETARSERSKPSLSNSPWMRGAPQVGFSTTMRKISSRNSLLIPFLPEIFRWRDIQFQYNRNPVRCQRTTVSGVTIIRACFHWDHRRRVITQNNLSGQPILPGIMTLENHQLLAHGQILQQPMPTK